jgi:hypothetical protein
MLFLFALTTAIQATTLRIQIPQTSEETPSETGYSLRRVPGMLDLSSSDDDSNESGYTLKRVPGMLDLSSDEGSGEEEQKSPVRKLKRTSSDDALLSEIFDYGQFYHPPQTPVLRIMHPDDCPQSPRKPVGEYVVGDRSVYELWRSTLPVHIQDLTDESESSFGDIIDTLDAYLFSFEWGGIHVLASRCTDCPLTLSEDRALVRGLFAFEILHQLGMLDKVRFPRGVNPRADETTHVTAFLTAVRQHNELMNLILRIANDESVPVDRFLSLVGSVAHVNQLYWFTQLCHH